MKNIKNWISQAITTRWNTNFKKEYHEISNLSNNKMLNTFLEKRFSNLLLHAYNHSSYYHKIFDQINLIKDDYVDLSRIHEIPILTKDVIRKNYNELISDDYQKRGWYYNSSGGSTGEPIRLIQDADYLKWRNATNYYYYKNILNIEEPIEKKVLLWGSERDLFQGSIGIKANIKNWISNTVLLNSFKMTEQDIERYLQTINLFKPEIIRGYAGSLFVLCQYAQQKNLWLHTPKIVVSAAETLSDNMRKTIESAFRTRVYNFYGSREVSNIAGECKDGNMHAFMFWNYIEVLDTENNPVKTGKEGKVIVTNLFNYSMPIIRYEIGDMAVLGPERCSCGNILPTLKKVIGRVTDNFFLKDGTIIYGEYFTHLFYFKDWIKSFQVIQEDYSKIRILIVSYGEFNLQEKKEIEDKIKLVMGHDCTVIWDVVDRISKTNSGKYLYTKSLIWK